MDKLKNADRAIHNFLISLYAMYDSKKLIEYLNAQEQELSPVKKADKHIFVDDVSLMTFR